MPSPYDHLLEQIQAILAEGQTDRRQAGEREKVETYWHIGHAVYVHLQDRKDRAAYGEGLIPNLSKDIQLPESTLHDIVLFRRAFTNLSTSRELTWSHYRALIRLPRAEQRRYYEREADEQRWSVRDLQAHIGAGAWERAVGAPLVTTDTASSESPLRARRGQLYTYRVLADRTDPDRRVLDLGFHLQHRVAAEAMPGVEPGDVVVSTLSPDGTCSFTPDRSRRPKLWTYHARLDRVIDGDTLIAVVDLGFHMQTPQRLRLRGIDTPEKSFKAGQRAHQFVVDALADAPRLVVSTARTDRYGRYVADVFYLPGETNASAVLDEGIFLNRQLLDERLAVRVT